MAIEYPPEERTQLVKKLNRSTIAIPSHLHRPTKPPSSTTPNPQKQTQHPTPKSMNSLILTNSVSEFIEQDATRLYFKRHGTVLIRLEELILNIDLPTIEVRFEHLNVNSEANVGGRALPTILNFSINILEGFLNYLRIFPSRKKPLAILHNVSGIIKPGSCIFQASAESRQHAAAIVASCKLQQKLGFERDGEISAVEMAQFEAEKKHDEVVDKIFGDVESENLKLRD
ncbi:Pleiotropic drug resistance protein 1 [Camellia lanceoleosa]|uniref:Pleiotropic drug resistance protein 1 n=1 Tax=Camellia lanceoleosa TaxID=1840588 RepID=A0ACC0FPR6_9ERIC|nr:Pleiotropic drug resistance protein 1 [Camellia lanceoleosa]